MVETSSKRRGPRAATHARNLKIVEAYRAGTPGTELAEQYSLTRARIGQIIQEYAPDAVGVDERVKVRDEAHQKAVSDFARDYGASIAALASNGVSRIEAEARIRVFLPHVKRDVIREGIEATRAHFDREAPPEFTSASLVTAVLYAVTHSRNLTPNVTYALARPDLVSNDEVQELTTILLEANPNVTPGVVTNILASVAAARALLVEDTSVTLTVTAYRAARLAALTALGQSSDKGSAPWPPTDQTITKRLGDRSWNAAMEAAGLSTNRSTDVPREFSNEAMLEAVADFIAYCDQAHWTTTVTHYEDWVKREYQETKTRRPSSATIRHGLGVWNSALRAAGAVKKTKPKSPPQAAGDLAKIALFDANSAIERLESQLKEVSSHDRHTVVQNFVTTFVQSFEGARLSWLAAKVQATPDAAERRMQRGMSDLPKPAKLALQGSPPDAEAAVRASEHHLVRLLGKEFGLRDVDGWLDATAQQALDALDDRTCWLFTILRESRHIFSHPDPKVAEARFVSAAAQLAKDDPRLGFKQSPTRLMIARWWLREDGYRLTLAASSVTTFWEVVANMERGGTGQGDDHV